MEPALSQTRPDPVEEAADALADDRPQDVHPSPMEATADDLSEEDVVELLEDCHALLSALVETVTDLETLARVEELGERLEAALDWHLLQ
jgi:hypothetical protein